MIISIPDSLVEPITIAPAPLDSLKYVEVGAEAELLPIKDLLESVSPDDLDLCAKGIRDQTEFGNDTADCNFGHYLEPDEEPFDGVRIRALFGSLPPIGQIVISREAFDRLISRYFATIILVVEQRYPRLVTEP